MSKNKRYILIIIIIAIIPLISFLRTRNNDTNSLAELPTLEVIGEMSKSNRMAVIEEVNSTPVETVSMKLEELIVDYISTQDKLDILELNIYEDTLLMYENKNEKKSNNINIDLVLSIGSEWYSIDDIEEMSYTFDKDIYNLINKDTYGFYKVASFSITMLDHKNMRDYSYIHTKTKMSEIVPLVQSEEEYRTQTIVYNFVHQYNNFVLKRFGIKKTQRNYILKFLYIMSMIKKSRLGLLMN